MLAELRALAGDPEFHGTVSDLGGPTANMYGTGCRRDAAGCRRASCLFPEVCPNLNTDTGPYRALLRAAREVPGVRHVFVSSGLRYDLVRGRDGEAFLDQLVGHHVGGRLKTAPEHVADNVLRVMRKPPAKLYREFLREVQACARRLGQPPPPIVEYFISGHPGCTLADMVELAEHLHRAQIRPEQVQDFYPAPLTLAAAMFYTGTDPLTGEAVYVARTDADKALQRALLLHHDPAFHRKAREALRSAGREDLIGRAPHCLVPPGP